MPRTSRRNRIAALVVLYLLALISPADAIEQSEVVRIQALLDEVKKSGVSFVRNGDTYTSERAAEHLKTKWGKGARYVHTAEDFIDNIASRSSATGKPYLVILPDGKRLEAAVWLRGLLKAVDARSRTAAPIAP